jgi:hypothetical protein
MDPTHGRSRRHLDRVLVGSQRPPEIADSATQRVRTGRTTLDIATFAERGQHAVGGKGAAD